MVLLQISTDRLIRGDALDTIFECWKEAGGYSREEEIGRTRRQIQNALTEDGSMDRLNLKDGKRLGCKVSGHAKLKFIVDETKTGIDVNINTDNHTEDADTFVEQFRKLLQDKLGDA